MTDKIGLTYFTRTPIIAELLCRLSNNPAVILGHTHHLHEDKLRIQPALMRDGALVFCVEELDTLENWLNCLRGIKHIIVSGDLDPIQLQFLNKNRYAITVIHTFTTEVEKARRAIPGLNDFNGDIFEISSSLSHRERLKKTVRHIHVPQNIQDRMLRRLDEGNHPVSIEVDRLDGKRMPTSFTPKQDQPQLARMEF